MCRHGDEVSLPVRVDERDSHTGNAYHTHKAVDRCIADVVDALNSAEIWTRTSCCGHGERDGEILLADGRLLVVRRDVTHHTQDVTVNNDDIAKLRCLIEQAETRILDPEDSSDPHLQDAAFYSRLLALYLGDTA